MPTRRIEPILPPLRNNHTRTLLVIRLRITPTLCAARHDRQCRFFRRRRVDSVMRELKLMRRRYRFREVMFNDAILFTDKKWLRELLIRFKSEIGVPFRCFGQVRFLDE